MSELGTTPTLPLQRLTPGPRGRSDAEETQPDRPEPPALAAAAGYLFGLGATLALLLLALPHSAQTDDAGVIVTATLAYLTAGLMLTRADRLPAWSFPAFLAYGTGLITSGIFFSGDPTSAYALLYLWVAVYSFYFFSRRQAILQSLLIGGAYAVVVFAEGHDQAAIGRWLITLGSLAGAGGLVELAKGQMAGLSDRLTDASRTDNLTSLLNRTGFMSLLDLERERAHRSAQSLSVVIGDIDGFRELNDECGDDVGDMALQRVADVLRREKRLLDGCARIGGEEFGVLMPDTDEHQAFIFAERLRTEVKEALSDLPVPLTISFGIACFPRHGITVSGLLRGGNQAVFAAKELGRDRTVIHNAEIGMMLKGAASRRDGERQVQLATVVTLAEALDVRDTGTARHSRTVGRYAEMMARELGLSEAAVERVRYAGMLHDVGKIGVGDRVLRKPGPLSDPEQGEMRKHPEIAARILGGAHLDDIRGWILAHHERPDGTGYPRGLTGYQLPLEAKILAVADAYEAMTIDRVYRPAMNESAARDELRRCAGTQFDEQVVEAFLLALEREADHPLVRATT